MARKCGICGCDEEVICWYNDDKLCRLCYDYLMITFEEDLEAKNGSQNSKSSMWRG